MEYFPLVDVAAAAPLSRSFTGLSPVTEAWATVQLNPLPCECELKMKLRLSDINTHALEDYKVKASDRNYQLLERNPLSIELWSRQVFIEKLNYIHINPVKYPWKLCQFPEQYKYSSASFYENGKDDYNFLSHYPG